MPGEPPLDGSPDPVGPEPDPYEVEDRQDWQSRDPEKHLNEHVSKPFDLVTDSYSEWRYNDYLDWIADRPQTRVKFIECKECGLGLNENNYPSGQSDRAGVCFDCLEGHDSATAEKVTLQSVADLEVLPKRDPTPTLVATRPLNFDIELELPLDSADPDTRTWQLMDSPLRNYGIAFFTSGLLGLLIEESPHPEPLEQYQLSDWGRSYVTVSPHTQAIIEDLGFAHPIRTGVSIRLNLPWRPDGHRWRFLILGR